MGYGAWGMGAIPRMPFFFCASTVSAKPEIADRARQGFLVTIMITPWLWSTPHRLIAVAASM
jgi:hypothetical protein